MRITIEIDRETFDDADVSRIETLADTNIRFMLADALYAYVERATDPTKKANAETLRNAVLCADIEK